MRNKYNIIVYEDEIPAVDQVLEFYARPYEKETFHKGSTQYTVTLSKYELMGVRVCCRKGYVKEICDEE